jgi:hypothetical protein
MKFSRLSEEIKRAFRRVKAFVIQDCPPELMECQVCGKLECSSEEWLNCEKRLATAGLIRSLENSPDCSFQGDAKKQDLPELGC